MVTYLAGNRIRGTNAERTSVAISGTPATETVFDATTQSQVSTAFCYSGYAYSSTRFGTRIDAGFSGIGKYIKKIMLPLDKTGSPTGNCWYAVFDSSNVEKARTNTKDVSTLPSTTSSANAEDTELTLESFVKLEAGDIVAMVYESGSAGNYPQTYSASTSLISNTTPMKYGGNVWAYRADRNIWFKFDSTPASAVVSNISDGSIFYETDTNKEYVLYNNTWTEL
jgi:hypothetical protein